MFMLTSGKKIMKIWLLLKPGQNKKGQKKFFRPSLFCDGFSTLFGYL